MVAQTYDAALRRLLAHEGGYTDHPADPGGPTNFGITIHDYRRYVNPRASAADVKAMRLDEAKAIYRSKYWDAVRCDALPAGLDYALFDYSVNSGTGRAVRVLQRLLHCADDGRMTDAVLTAAQRHRAADLIAAMCDERLAFLKRLKTWSVFGAGWSRRVAEVRAAALVMAAGGRSQTTEDNRPAAVTGKGAVPLNASAQKGTAGGIAAAGAAAAQQAHQAGVSAGIVAAIFVIAIALAVAGWFAWRWHQRRQQKI